MTPERWEQMEAKRSAGFWADPRKSGPGMCTPKEGFCCVLVGSPTPLNSLFVSGQ